MDNWISNELKSDIDNPTTDSLKLKAKAIKEGIMVCECPVASNTLTINQLKEKGYVGIYFK